MRSRHQYTFNGGLSVEAFARALSFRLFDGLGGDTSYYPSVHSGVAAIGGWRN